MNRHRTFFIKRLLPVIFLAAGISSCGQTAGEQFQATVHHLSAEAFRDLVRDSTGILLDVRTQQEYNNGHLRGSGQMNYYDRDFGNRLLMLSRDEAIFLYCNTGFRSGRAAQFLVQNGYQRVYNMHRGIMEWNYHNLPVERTPGALADTENRFGIEQFREVIGNDTLVFVDFYAPWCAPCRRMMPLIDSLITEYTGQVHILKVNADASRELMRELHITGVPYFILFHRGNVVFHKGGMVTRQELEELFSRYLGNR
jgi:thioredoxin 1